MIDKFEYDPQYHEYYPSPEMQEKLRREEQERVYQVFRAEKKSHAVAYKLSMEEVYGPYWWRYK